MNLGDLEHLRAVKMEKHTKYANDKKMHSFMVSAKTGESVSTFIFYLKQKFIILLNQNREQVNLMFQQIAAQILGVTLTRIQVEGEQRVVKAEIVKFKEQKPNLPQTKKSSICTLQ